MVAAQHAVYEAVQTTTADPTRILLLLLDGAARSLRQAADALDRGDSAGFAYPLSRAHAIIAELSGSLDRDAGGELAAQLDRLYDFMLHHLSAGLVAKSAPHVVRVREMLEELRDGFQQAARSVSHGTPA
jgi:flagellar protein FliS